MLRIAETPYLSPGAAAYGRANAAAVRLIDCTRAQYAGDPDFLADPSQPLRRAVAAYGTALADLARHDQGAADRLDESVQAAIGRLKAQLMWGMDQTPGFSFTGGRPCA